MGRLLKEIKEQPSLRGGTPKKVDLILGLLSEQDATDLLEAINDHTISGSVIARVLRKKGFEITRKSIQRYRGLYNES